MTAARKPLACPQCNAELSLEMLFAHQEDCDAVDALITLTIPVGAQLLRYAGLFAPASSRMSTARKIKLLGELLPDLQRGAVHRRGRDWTVSHANWMTAIDQMLIQVAAGKLALPLTGHGYLYEILAGIADKAEASAERQREAERRDAGKASFVVRGESMPMDRALETAFSGRDPELIRREHEAATTPKGVPAHLKQQIADLKKRSS